MCDDGLEAVIIVSEGNPVVCNISEIFLTGPYLHILKHHIPYIAGNFRGRKFSKLSLHDTFHNLNF